MAHLTLVTRKSAPPSPGEFPFSVPAIRSLTRLDLSAPVTFFVGENGSGKSTLLEGIAAAAELPTLGGQRALAATLRLAWTKRTRRGFFLRAEEFFGYLRRLARQKARIIREDIEAKLGRPLPGREDDIHSG